MRELDAERQSLVRLPSGEQIWGVALLPLLDASVGWEGRSLRSARRNNPN